MMPTQLQPLANHLWQSTLSAVIAGLLTLAFRKNRAETRYWLWLAASMKFLIPFSLLRDIGGRIASYAKPSMAAADLPLVIQRVTQPFAVSTPVHSITAVSPNSPANWITALLCSVWAAGIAALIFSWWRPWRGLRAALRTASPLDLPICIPVMTSAAFGQPGIFGIYRPVLLLPAGIRDRLTPAELKTIIAHELCHVCRRDNLTTAIHMAVEALFWFHPLVWWLGARLMEERERACDEAVLSMGNEPQAYAEGILKICEIYLDSPLPCVSGVTGSNLKRRIEFIMHNRTALGLNFFKKLFLIAAGTAAILVPLLLGVLNGPTIRAQSTPLHPAAQPLPSFEVASIKPDKDCPYLSGVRSFSPSPGRLEMPCVTLQALIQAAYGTFGDGISINTTPLHMEGGPSWMRSDFYTLSAKADLPVRTEMLAGPMLQALLAERFHLLAHRETREMPVYTLTVGKSGPKMQPLVEGACAPLDLSHPPPPPKPGSPPPNVCSVMILGPTANGGMRMDVRGATMTQFAQRLSGRLDRTVIDKTGIAGMFNFHLEFARDPTMPGQQLPPVLGGNAPHPPPSADPGPNLFGAVQEQLGLKLETATGPAEVLVIDHWERPTEN